MIVPPGQRKFKLRKLDEPIKGPDGIKYTHVCDKLAEPPCQACHNGMIEVAYGERAGVYDVYRFPCKCSFSSGLEWWQTDNVERYTGRPIAYSCTEEQMPGHVFIHPIHSAKKAKELNAFIRQIVTKMQMTDEELPF